MFQRLVFAVMVGVVVWLAVLVGTSLTAAQRTAQHPAFRDAGRRPGLQIWRVVNFVPEPVEPKDYGKFYEGDSYILLSTKEEAGKKGSYVWDIFYWLGSKTSQDESGAAAILAVSLDDGLGGGPVQHREEQAHESGQFMALFKQGGVRYVAGGAPSGFHHVEINAAGEKRLYQVKGKRNVRVTQVSPEAKSMNKGDCFILDSGRDIYVWVGSKAKGQERVKAIGAANLIRDQDHAGRGKVAVLDGSSSPEEFQKFFAELGSGTASQVANEPSVDDDQDFEKKIDGLVALHKVSDANGKLVSQRISTKPLTQALLDPNDCFVLDTVTSGIFVWIGRKSTSQEKVRALQMGQAFLADNHYPKWTRMRRVVEGSEPAAFREYFAGWSDARRAG